MCACKLPGGNVLEKMEYQDDGEHKVGKVVLDYMNSVKLTNCALFITRHYNGEHIGPKRFECILEAAKAAVNSRPLNKSTQSFQFSWGHQENKETKVSKSEEEIVFGKNSSMPRTQSWAELVEANGNSRECTTNSGHNNSTGTTGN